mmetsp:Transcript_33068/g.97444  ORF Transcript_33068/g.97444 Transcript_33068/m.97444 type:complete len:314 (-) Transcript_33068:143-1084(-)
MQLALQQLSGGGVVDQQLGELQLLVSQLAARDCGDAVEVEELVDGVAVVLPHIERDAVRRHHDARLLPHGRRRGPRRWARLRHPSLALRLALRRLLGPLRLLDGGLQRRLAVRVVRSRRVLARRPRLAPRAAALAHEHRCPKAQPPVVALLPLLLLLAKPLHALQRVGNHSPRHVARRVARQIEAPHGRNHLLVVVGRLVIQAAHCEDQRVAHTRLVVFARHRSRRGLEPVQQLPPDARGGDVGRPQRSLGLRLCGAGQVEFLGRNHSTGTPAGDAHPLQPLAEHWRVVWAEPKVVAQAAPVPPLADVRLHFR